MVDTVDVTSLDLKIGYNYIFQVNDFGSFLDNIFYFIMFGYLFLNEGIFSYYESSYRYEILTFGFDMAG